MSRGEYEIFFPASCPGKNTLSGIVCDILDISLEHINVSDTNLDTLDVLDVLDANDITSFTILFKNLITEYDEIIELQKLFCNPCVLSIKVEADIGTFRINSSTKNGIIGGTRILDALQGFHINKMWVECTSKMWNHKVINT